MPAPEQGLIDQIRDIGRGFIETNKDSQAIKFLKSVVNTLDSTLNKIDKFLKTKNIDVGESARQLQSRGKSLLDYGKASLTSAVDSIKNKGFKTYLTDTYNNVRSKVTEKFSSDTEQSSGPPEQNVNPVQMLANTMNSLKNSIVQLTQSTNDKIDTEEEKKDDNKKSILQRFKDSIEKEKERKAARKKEIEEEKKAVKEGIAKPKGKGVLGWLKNIVGAITSVGGLLFGGLKGLALSFAPMMIRSIFKGTTWALSKVMPKFVTGIAGSIGRIFTMKNIGTAAATVGRGAWWVARQGAMMLGRMAIGALATTAGTVALAGAAVVGLGIAGYYGYKYLTRNDLKDSIYGRLTRLRLLMYGFNDVKKDYYYKLLQLEGLMKEYYTYTDHKFKLKNLDKDIRAKILELFSVKPDDKEKVKLLNNWFQRRFIPAYVAFMTSFKEVSPKEYLDDIEKLNNDKIFDLMSMLQIPTSIYQVENIPTFEDPKTTVTQQEVETLKENIINEAKKNSEKLKGKDTSQLKIENDKYKQEQRAIEEAKNKELQSTVDKAVQQGNATRLDPTMANSLAANKAKVESDSEGEKPATIVNNNQQTTNITNNPIPEANGNLVTDNANLEGLTSKLSKDKITGIDKNMLMLLAGMAKEYNALTGKKININEGFRSRKDQEALKAKYGARAASPGKSLHEFGIAVDIPSETANELEKLGLLRKYGFTRPVGKEPWHLENAGVSLDPNRSKLDIAYRTAAILASPGRGGDGYGTLASANQYRRDINYQKQLYNNGKSQPIDMAKLGQETNLQPNINNQPTKTTATTVPSSQQTTDTSSTLVPSTQPTLTNNQASTNTTNSTNYALANRASPFVGQASNTNLNYNEPTVPSNPNMDMGKVDPNMHPIAAIKQASNMVGMDPNTMTAFARIESGLRPAVKAPTSSATGLFQITNGTWRDLMRKYGSKYNIPANASPTHPLYNSILGVAYAKENLQALGNTNVPGLSDGSKLYLAHHFGPGGARSIIRTGSNPNTPISRAVSPQVYNANRQELGNKTIGQYYQYLNNKLAKNGAPGAIVENTPSGQVVSTPVETPNVATTDLQPLSNQQPIQTPNLPSPQPSTRMISNMASSQVQEEPIQQPSPTSSFSKAEGIMSDQLKVLVEIKNILTTISNKESSPMTEGSPKQEQQPNQPNQQTLITNPNDSMSRYTVNLSRKAINSL